MRQRYLNASFLNFLPNPRLYLGLNLKIQLDNDITCITTNSGHVWCWGNNEHLKLGVYSMIKCISTPSASLAERHNPIIPIYLNQYDQILLISSGKNHTGFLSKNGQLFTSGKNDYGQLGSLNQFFRVVRIDNELKLDLDEKIIAIDFLDNVSSAFTNKSRAFIWGSNINKLVLNEKKINKLPIDITKSLNLNEKDQLTHFQLILTSSEYMNKVSDVNCLIVTNYKTVLLFRNNEILDISKFFEFKKNYKILDLKAFGTKLLLETEEKDFYFLDLKDYNLIKKETKAIELKIIIESICLGSLKEVHLSGDALTILTDKGELIDLGYNRNNIFVTQNESSWDKPVEFSKRIGLKVDEVILSLGQNEYNTVIFTNQNRLLVWGSNKYGGYGNNSTKDEKKSLEIKLPLYKID